MTVLLTQLRVIAIFDTTILQGSVATRLRYGHGVIFNYFVTRNLLLTLSVKEF